MGDGPTKYGFRYGPADVARAGQLKGHAVLIVQGAKQAVMVRVTPSGFVRVSRMHKPISPTALAPATLRTPTQEPPDA